MEAVKLLERSKDALKTIHLGPANTGTNEQTYIEVGMRWLQAYICIVWWSLEVAVLSALGSANLWKMQVAETMPGPQRLSSYRDYPKLSEALNQVSKCWPCFALHRPSHRMALPGNRHHQSSANHLHNYVYLHSAIHCS